MPPQKPNAEVRSRKAGAFIPHRPKWHGQVAAWSVAAIMKVSARTWRVPVQDESGWFEGNGEGPAIFALWHNRLAVSMAFWTRYVRDRRKSSGLAALISASKDGAVLARTLEYFDVRAVRGSSSRRGAQALIELTRVLKQGYHVAITPDGPRGPKYVLHDGILSLAQVSGKAIIPVGVYIDKKFCLKSWDAFQVPLPGARCEFRVGQAIQVPREASPEEFNQARERLKSAMAQLNRD